MSTLGALPPARSALLQVDSGRAYCLPDMYEVQDRSLADIQYVLNPTFTGQGVGGVEVAGWVGGGADTLADITGAFVLCGRDAPRWGLGDGGLADNPVRAQPHFQGMCQKGEGRVGWWAWGAGDLQYVLSRTGHLTPPAHPTPPHPNIQYTAEDVAKLDSGVSWARALDGSEYMPGLVGLNNMKQNDYANVVAQALIRVWPIRCAPGG